MRIQYMSDLHMELWDNSRYIKANEFEVVGDVLVFAGIETVAKSETAFGDNHDLLRTIKSDAESILSLNFENTRYFKSSKTISYDRF